MLRNFITENFEKKRILLDGVQLSLQMTTKPENLRSIRLKRMFKHCRARVVFSFFCAEPVMAVPNLADGGYFSLK